MGDFDIVVDSVRAEKYAAAPTLTFGLKMRATERVHVVALRCQVRIEPQARHYSVDEEMNLVELFGPTPQWGESLRPFLWTHASVLLPGFDGEGSAELPVLCTYDFEVVGAKFIHSLGDGDIPLLFLFSGTAIFGGPQDGGIRVSPVSWQSEARFRLPVSTYRAMMDAFFPNSGWLRLHRDTIDALMRFKASRAIGSWDAVIDTLLAEAEAKIP